MDCKTHIEQLIHEAVKTSQDSLKNHYPDFCAVKIGVKIDFSSRRTSHRGGWYAKGPTVNMAANYFLLDYSLVGIRKFTEYPSFGLDPVIGHAYYEDVKHNILLATGHEVAHACQYHEKKMRKLENNTPHGLLFKEIYRIIRLEINKCLPDQKKAKNLYNSFLLSIKKRELNGIN
jgi:hypothetical protein